MSSPRPVAGALREGTPSACKMATSASPIEPSPASTYGDSAASDAGDEVPQTPGLELDEGGVLLTEMKHLIMDDDHNVAGKVVEHSGSYSIEITGAKGCSPRYSPPFVRNGAQSSGEDPFQSQTPLRRRSKSHGSNKATSAGMNAPQKMRNENWRSSSSSGSDSSSPSGAKRRRFYNATLARAAMDPSVVRAEDAQAVYHPSCCVFVANLLQSESEESLQVAVTQVFREFGAVYVKIRRDGRQMPFAFCQYTREGHAERAIREGRGRLIKGRPCRCEKAKAHRLFFIERKYGPVLTSDEARNLLKKFGKIELCYTASHVERTALNLNEGVIVQFEMYDEGQDAHSAFRNHELFKMQPIAGLASPARREINRSPDTEASRSYLARYDVDRRSIFVGNLPIGTSEEQVNGLFEHYGYIKEIIIRETTSRYAPDEKLTFAFVEFKSPMAVGNAIAAKNGFNFTGKTLRVCQKDSEVGSHRYRQARTQPRGPVALEQSSPSRQVDQAASPAAQVAIPGYAGSPYAYQYSPYYSHAHPTGPVYTDGLGHYYPAPYSPAHYSYLANPGYDVRTTGISEVAGSPSGHAGYYGYPPYAYAPAPYWNVAPAIAEQQATNPVTYCPTACAPAIVSGSGTASGPEDRSATPTPAGHASAAESS
ncbi:hypothetical protein B7494_g3501 [Chlorociboria aeruginascens]|nr:hypothetical protein B7494_g3501 [Chlorociboria aeruginascens]